MVARGTQLLGKRDVNVTGVVMAIGIELVHVGAVHARIVTVRVHMPMQPAHLERQQTDARGDGQDF